MRVSLSSPLQTHSQEVSSANVFQRKPQKSTGPCVSGKQHRSQEANDLCGAHPDPEHKPHCLRRLASQSDRTRPHGYCLKLSWAQAMWQDTGEVAQG